MQIYIECQLLKLKVTAEDRVYQLESIAMQHGLSDMVQDQDKELSNPALAMLLRSYWQQIKLVWKCEVSLMTLLRQAFL